MSRFTYAFFDLDGTLTDPALGITNSFIYSLKTYGIEVRDRSELYKYIGPPLVDTFRTAFGIPPEECMTAVHRYREYFANGGLFENTVYDGIPETLAKLKSAGIHIVTATSKPEPYAVKILEHFGLAEYFDMIAGSLLDETRAEKKEVIAYAISSLGITDRKSIIMIGDRKFDVIGAKTLGLSSMGVLYGYGTREEMEEAAPDFIASSPSEIAEILLGN